MAIQDGTPREPYTGPRNTQGDRPSPPMRTGLVSTIVVLTIILLGLVATFYEGKREVTNAPAGTPPSIQQPDTTPPANQTPSK